MLKFVWIGAIAIAFFSVPACKDSTAPPQPCSSDSGVAVAVVTNPTPTFSWTPECLVFRLGVADSTGRLVWEIAADSTATLRSGVVYGVVPRDAIETHPAETLLAGRRYFIGLYAAPGDSIAIGAAAFIR